MRIGLIAPPWCAVPPATYGGIELVVALLAQEWVRAGHDVTLVASGDSEAEGRLVATFPNALGTATDDVFLEGVHALRAYEALEDVDVVHDHTGVVVAAIATRDRSLPPVVHTLHGPWTPNARMFYDLVHHDIDLVAISESQRRANPGVRYAATIHNGIDLDAYPMNDGERGDGLVFIGRANPGKNPDGAIRVARAAGRDLTLIVKRHETAEREYWESAVAPLLGSDVEVVEDVDQTTKVALLQQAHAMVFPIEWPEPFGLVMIEAMACGTPVVARPCGAAEEVIDHARTGFLCASEAEMVAAIDCVDELDRRASRDRVADLFSSRSMASRYEHLFDTLVCPAASETPARRLAARGRARRASLGRPTRLLRPAEG